MCFNAESSIAAFTFAILCSIYLIIRGFKLNDKNDKTTGMILIFIANMQLLEYFLWKNQNCGNVNQILTILIVIAISLQAFSTFFISNYYYPNHLNKTIYYIPVVLFILVILLILNELIKNKNKLCTLKDKNSCRLL